jgi:hypothetical protein
VTRGCYLQAPGRALACQAGLTAKALAAQVRVSFAKVAEYQRRGVVHFHAIIRLDGPAGPVTGPPTRERWGSTCCCPRRCCIGRGRSLAYR